MKKVRSDSRRWDDERGSMVRSLCFSIERAQQLDSGVIATEVHAIVHCALFSRSSVEHVDSVVLTVANDLRKAPDADWED